MLLSSLQLDKIFILSSWVNKKKQGSDTKPVVKSRFRILPDRRIQNGTWIRLESRADQRAAVVADVVELVLTVVGAVIMI